MNKKVCILSLILIVLTLAGCNKLPEEEIDSFLEYSKIGNTATDSYWKFKNINLENSYLGYGYDVINDGYMDKDAIQMSSPIMDMEKIKDAKLKLVKENRSKVTEYEASTMEEFSMKYSAGFNIYGNVSRFFSGGLKMDFNGSTNSKSYWHFYKSIYDVRTFNLYLTNELSEIKEMLSASFLKDLETLEPLKLFDKYGTHLIREVVMGGRMEINATYSSETAKDSTSVAGAVNAHIKFLKSSINIEGTGSYENELKNHNITQTTLINQFGGKLVDTHDPASLSKNYKEWVDSFEELENSALSGIVGGNSLIGLWELLSNTNQKRKTQLEEAFVKLAGDKYEELCSQFKLKKIEDKPVVDQPDPIDTYHIRMSRENCALDNGYDPSNKEGRQDLLDRHNGFEVGELILSGCSKKNNTYSIKKPFDFSIKYAFLMVPSSLPVVAGEASYIEKDTCNKVYNTSINKEIGCGAYWIRITYKNNNQKEISQTNFMENKTQGSIVSLVDTTIDNIEHIKKIEIVVVYEHFTGGPGVMGIWWKDYTNWRCSYTFDFS